MWLPKPEDGPPRILGLFEQRVEGVTGKFSGAQLAAIDQNIAREMMTEAAILGALLQRIGYFGPCSLDAVIKEVDGGSELHWVECNGRWSGVSIPLAAVRGLFENSMPEGLVILQELLPDAERMSTSGLCTLLGEILFRKGASTEGIVILSPPDRTDGMSVNVMVLAETQSRAASIVEELYRRLSSRST